MATEKGLCILLGAVESRSPSLDVLRELQKWFRLLDSAGGRQAVGRCIFALISGR